MINFNNVTKTFMHKNKLIKAVDHLNLTIKKGEIFGILGESGAGKSTLLRLINRLEKPDQGTVSIENRNLKDINKKDLRQLRQEVAFIFQNYNLIKNKPVYENLAIALKIKNEFDENKIYESLDFVGLRHKATQYPAQLSGGERQRIAIARAILVEPKILLCDEPTSSLDQKNTNMILDLIKKVNKEFQTTVVIVTHELPVVKELCDRAGIMHHGEMQEIVDVVNHNHQDINTSYVDYAKEVLMNG